MRSRRKLSSKLITAMLPLILLSCSYDRYVLASAPEVIDRAVLRNSIAVQPARKIDSSWLEISGGDYIYLNVPYQGYHIIDNRDPTKPSNVGFLAVPGALSGAYSNGYLYVNNADDLVVLGLSDGAHPSVVRRLERVLQFVQSPHTPTIYGTDDQHAIIGWHDTVVVQPYSPLG